MVEGNKIKGLGVIFLFAFGIIIFVGFASAGIGDWFKSLTGKATSQNFGVNVSVGNNAPNITFVSPLGNINVNEDNVVNIQLNFTAYDADGSGNLVSTSGKANFTRGSEAVRANSSCVQLNTFSNYYANYTCTIAMWYYDGAGEWNITTYVADISGAAIMNTTTKFTLNELAAFKSSPSLLTFSSLNPGSVNQTASNDPLLMNNTGNKAIIAGNIEINATDLKGETDNTRAIYAGNISIGVSTGGTPPAECSGTSMNSSLSIPIGSATLPKGNYTVNDGSTGQEQLYFCIKKAGSELTTQAYSTSQMGLWTVKIA